MNQPVQGQPFLSLCIIVKDGAKTIGAMLDSVLKFDGIDEIVIVDTGSTDLTESVVGDRIQAEKVISDTTAGVYTAVSSHGRIWKFAQFAWVPADDLSQNIHETEFAAARAYAFSLANGVWRMYLDADDVLECRHPAIVAGERRADGTLKRANLAASIRALAAKNPAVNMISFKYEFAQSGGEVTTQQDVKRAWRWADGWRWRDPVHESVEPTDDHVCVGASVTDTVVVHHKHPDAYPTASKRNMDIAKKALARDDVDEACRSRLMYGLTNALRHTAEYDQCVALLEDTIQRSYGTNFELHALCDLIQLLGIELGQQEDLPKKTDKRPYGTEEGWRMWRGKEARQQAILLAGQLIARWPYFKHGYEHLGWAYVNDAETLEDYARAAAAFDSSVGPAIREMSWSTVDEAWFHEGTVPVARALAYIHLGRIDEARELLVNLRYVRHTTTYPLFCAAQKKLVKLQGLHYVKQLADWLVDNYLPLSAIDLLQTAQDDYTSLDSERRTLCEREREVAASVAHLDSFEAYKAAYESLPEEVLSPKKLVKQADGTTIKVPVVTKEGILAQTRSAVFMSWVRSLPEDWIGDVCFIGIQDVEGIESEALALRPGLRATFVEIIADSPTVKTLTERFNTHAFLNRSDKCAHCGRTENELFTAGGDLVYTAVPCMRLQVHVMKDILDWQPWYPRPEMIHSNREHVVQGRQFDAVVCYEVIEHIEATPAELLYDMLNPATASKPGGRLFLSTPLIERWVNSNNSKKLPPFLHHVRAFSAGQLFDDLNPWFMGELVEGADGILVFEGVVREARYTPIALKMAIFVPEGPEPFDARSHERGHLGGSEEAVIHLAEALAKHGHYVTVYAPVAASTKSIDVSILPDGTLGGNAAERIHGRNGVLWRATREFDFGGDDHDVVLFWRCPHVMNIKDTKGESVKFGDYTKVLWLHDSFYSVPGRGPEVLAKAYAKADLVVALSQYHRDAIEAHDVANAPRMQNTVVLQNGIDVDSFPLWDESPQRCPACNGEDERVGVSCPTCSGSGWLQSRDFNKVLYTSSPDRGLVNLLNMWPHIKARAPAATLDIYYDWKNAGWLRPELMELLKEQLAFLSTYEVQREDGNGKVPMDITLKGGVSHKELHEAMRHAGVWAYPHEGGAASSDYVSAETFCITAVKMQAAGCWPVTTDAGALPEVVRTGEIVPLIDGKMGLEESPEPHAFENVLVKVLTEHPTNAQRVDMRAEVLKQYSWAKTAEMFEEAFSRVGVASAADDTAEFAPDEGGVPSGGIFRGNSDVEDGEA